MCRPYNKKSIHNKLSRQLIAAFPSIVVSKRLERAPSAKDNDPFLDPYWISGFIEGDGSFYKFKEKLDVVPSGGRVLVGTHSRMSINLNIREESLKIQQYFGGLGSIYTNQGKKTIGWKVLKLSDLDSIIPHFDFHPSMGLKSYNCLIRKEIFHSI